MEANTPFQHSAGHKSISGRSRKLGDRFEPSLERRGCEELGGCDISGLSEDNSSAGCLVTTGVCFEYLNNRCDENSNSDVLSCQNIYPSILQSYDREMFAEISSVLWSLFSLSPERQQNVVKVLTESVSGEGAIDEPMKLFNSLFSLMPVVEDELIVKLNKDKWETIVDGYKNNPNNISEIANNMREDGGGIGSTAGGGLLGGLFGSVSDVFIFPEEFSFGEFLSEINWQGGLMENLGLNRSSFERITEHVLKEEGGEERIAQLFGDLGTLVRNIEAIGGVVTDHR